MATLPTDMSHPYFLLLSEASDSNVDRLNQLPERDQRQLDPAGEHFASRAALGSACRLAGRSLMPASSTTSQSCRWLEVLV
jgi:hypothetical protein